MKLFARPTGTHALFERIHFCKMMGIDFGLDCGLRGDWLVGWGGEMDFWVRAWDGFVGVEFLVGG